MPGGHWQITTLLEAVRQDDPLAPMLLDGPMDTAAFRAYIEQALCPHLHPGDIVVMDNLAPHKAASIAAAVEAVGAEVWYLPPYSPDLNPIEKMWSKVKTALRRRGRRRV